MRSNIILFCMLSALLTSCNNMNVCPIKSSHYVPISQDKKTSDKIIIFVHGLTGDVDTTWEYSKDVAWPKMLKNDPIMIGYDVYCVSYYTPSLKHASTVEQVEQRLLQQISDDGIFDYNEIYFVTHSLGGIIIKRALNDLNRPTELAKLRKVKAVIYISTPANGSELASLGSWISFNPQLKDISPLDLNSYLQSIENQWKHLIEDRDSTAAFFPKSFCAYETLPFRGRKIVSDIYSKTECDNVAFPLDLNHSTIVKPANRTVEPYKWSRSRILDTSLLVSKNNLKNNEASYDINQKKSLPELIADLILTFDKVQDNLDTFSSVEQDIYKILKIDPENGHALYYHDEVKRLKDTDHFTSERCIKNSLPIDFDIDQFQHHFYRYLENAAILQSNEIGGVGAKICHQISNGYCLERIAWINHLLANDLYAMATLCSDKDIKRAKLNKALELANEALKYIPPDSISKTPGFINCIPTIELKNKIIENINNI